MAMASSSVPVQRLLGSRPVSHAASSWEMAMYKAADSGSDSDCERSSRPPPPRATRLSDYANLRPVCPNKPDLQHFSTEPLKPVRIRV